MANKCPTCHLDNPEIVKFCGECGTQLSPAQSHRPALAETLRAPIRELATGSTFADRYQVIEELGQGGMGRVYKVFDTKIKEKVALKLIKQEIVSESDTLARFSNELKLARGIRHKNVCGMFDIGEAEGAHFITMEYVHGEDLKSMIRMSTGLTVGTVLSIGKQICSGLAEAHALGVVHRDLKPQNVMIDRGGNAKIMDFGIARSLRDKSTTGSGIVIGTPAYMSPEQAETKEVDARSDIYSLGVILYEMATGRVPFEGDTALSIAMKHKGETPKDPKLLNPSITDELSGLILKCLEKERSRRFQSVSEIYAQFGNIEKRIPTTERVVPGQRPSTSRESTLKFNVRRPLVPALLLGLLALSTFLAIRSGLFRREKGAVPATGRRSIAVLPFVDLSPARDHEYLGEGIAETLINALSSIPDLHVPARTSAFSFKNKNADIKEIGQKLGVTIVLEGSIQVSEGRLRVTSQLINVDDGYHLWSGKYDRNVSDVFAIQDDIAQRIIEALRIDVLGEKPARIIKQRTASPEAYDRYVQGLYIYNRRGEDNLKKAVGYFESAIKIDPEYALAYAQLGEAYATIGDWGYLPPKEAFPAARKAALKALEIDDSLAEAHCALAQVKYIYDWDWRAAEEEFRKGLALNPRFADGHKEFGEFLTRSGRFDESLRELDKAQELDPQSLTIRGIIGWALLYYRRFDESIEKLEAVLKMDPDFTPARDYLGRAYLYKYLLNGSYKEALEVAKNFHYEFGTALVQARMGRRSEARAVMDNYAARSEREPDLTFLTAGLSFALGERDQGFQWLERAFEYRHRMLTQLGIQPFLDPVRDDPRFLSMLRRIGLGN